MIHRNVFSFHITMIDTEASILIEVLNIVNGLFRIFYARKYLKYKIRF